MLVLLSVLPLSAQTRQEVSNILNNALDFLMDGALGELGEGSENVALFDGLTSTLTVKRSSGRGGFISELNLSGPTSNVKYIRNLFMDVLSQRRARLAQDSGHTVLYILGLFGIFVATNDYNDINMTIFVITVMRNQ
jgi:hypothetical protein